MVRIGSKSTSGWKATVAVSMSNYIEAGSIIAIATSLSAWQHHFGFTDAAAGWLAALSANAFGAAIGAIIGGPLSDRYGRKFIYTWDLILYMIGTLLAVFAGDFTMLLVAFVLTGIAVGAGVPASWTYIAETAPAGKRAAHVGAAQLAWSIGPMIGFLLAAGAAPLGLFGNRLIFAHLFVIAAITWWVRRGLPESQAWKDTQSMSVVKTSVLSGLRGLFSKRKNFTAILFLIGVYAFWNTVAGQAGIFMPRVYAASGVESTVEQYLLQALLWAFTVAATYFGFMRLADRFSRRWLYFIGAALGIIAWCVLIFAQPTLPVLLTFAIGWGVASGIGAQAFYGLWTSELFATPYRATAQGVLFTIARLMVGLLSLWFPIALASIGLARLGLILIALLAVSLVVGTIWAPKTRGMSLEQIGAQRYGTKPAPAGAASTTVSDAVSDPVSDPAPGKVQA